MAKNVQDLIENINKSITELSNVLVPAANHQQSVQPALAEDTMSRDRAMMPNSARNGVFRRLNPSERLRASASASTRTSATTSPRPAKKPELKPAKVFEFCLIQTDLYEDELTDEESDLILSKEMVLERGMVSLNEEDREADIRTKLKECLAKHFPLLGMNDFEFVEVIRKQIHTVQVNQEHNYPIVKKLAGQGMLYIRLKSHYKFVIDDTEEKPDDEPLVVDAAAAVPVATVTVPVATVAVPAAFPVTVPVLSNNNDGEKIEPVVALNGMLDGIRNVINDFPIDIINPIEMLKYLQHNIVLGRPLEIQDMSTCLDGQTNFISVDRDSVLSSTLVELENIEDLRYTFEVSFFGESAMDGGGPRREWIRLYNNEIKLMYFQNGYKEHLHQEYYEVRKLFAVALLQNFQVPRYFSPEQIEEIFGDEKSSCNRCISNLRKGMDNLGMFTFIKRNPLFLHLLRPSSNQVNFRMISLMLKPVFSDQGSNNLKYEKEIYSVFTRYLRDCSSGRRIVKLENIMEYVTGSTEEPPLGFAIKPSIDFPEVVAENSDDDDKENSPANKRRKVVYQFIPTAHTCTLLMHLPRPSATVSLPPEDEIFDLYDLAFKNSYFGLH